MKKVIVMCLILVFLLAGQTSADNRIMIMVDTIYSSTFDLPIGFENDELIGSFTNGYCLSTSGSITAQFSEYENWRDYINPDSRIGFNIPLNIVTTPNTILHTMTWLPPPGPITIPVGELETLFYFPIVITGNEGEICIDSCFIPPAGSWVWDGGSPIGNLNPTFNDGNGPHCITYTYKCGDANSDGLINISDAVWILSYIFRGGAAPEPLESGDANADGLVNVSDAVWIQNYIFKGGNAPCDPY
jgi:Dockerin type I domain